MKKSTRLPTHFISLILAALALTATAQTPYQNFETTTPASWTQTGSSELSLSQDRYKSGKQSLRWTWLTFNWNDQQPTLEFNDPAAFNLKGKNRGFALWVYNERPLKTPLQAELLSKGKVVAQCWFTLNYQGWAPLTASYNKLGLKQNQQIDSLRLIAPESAPLGQLFIDVAQFDLPNIAHHDHLTSYQKPTNSIYSTQNPNLNRPWLPQPKSAEDITAQEREDMQKIADRLLPKIIRPAKGLKPAQMDALRKEFADFQITRKNGIITGRPIDSASILKPTDRIDFWQLYKSCDKIEKAYRQAKTPENQAELKQMFVDLSEHLLDQGWKEGSTLRQRTNYPPAKSGCFLRMRDVLTEAGLARDMALFLAWSKACQNEGNYLAEKSGASMDGLGFWSNELVQYLLMIPDETERYNRLKIAQRFYSLALINPHTIAPDGCSYHHGAFHFAYASYNLPRLVRTLQAMAGTEFSLGQEAHERLKTYAHAIAFTFSNGTQPYNITARAGTPVSGNMITFATMLAQLGSSDGKQKIDQEMVSLAYSQILDKGKNGKALLNREPMKTWIAEGAKPTNLTGHINLNGSPLAIHRRPGWMVGIAGMSKNWRGLEIYGWTMQNNYGLFARNGSICVMANGNPPNLAESGWHYDGWNWAHFPGTTALQLTPRELFHGYTMIGNGSQVVGGTNMNNDGVWGYDYTGGNGVAFKKSTFCFDNRLTVITTGIKSNKDAPAITTLFQNHIQPGHEEILLSNGSTAKLPSSQKLNNSEAHWLIDNQGTGYLIPANQPQLQVQSQPQEWLYMIRKFLKDPKNDPFPTMKDYQGWNWRTNSNAKRMAELESHYTPSKGNFALAYFDHGKKPQNASCAYTIVIQTDAEKMKSLATNSPTQILQQNNNAHILRDISSSTTGYILYTPNEKLTADTHILSNSLPCFAMITDAEKDKLALSIACPVITRTTHLILTIKGNWKTNHPSIKTKHQGQNTILTLEPNYYMPLKFTLTK